MKGMHRTIDQLGRLVLPMEIRKDFGLEEGSELNIEVREEGILLIPRKKACSFCGSKESLIEISGKSICLTCANELAGIVKAKADKNGGGQA